MVDAASGPCVIVEAITGRAVDDVEVMVVLELDGNGERPRASDGGVSKNDRAVETSRQDQ